MKAVSSNQASHADSYSHQYSYKVPVITDGTTANAAKLIGAGTLATVIVIFASTFAKRLFQGSPEDAKGGAKKEKEG